MKNICKNCLQNLGDQTRVDIYFTLLKGSKCVKELISEFKLSQSTISYHLGVMNSAGLLTKKQVGRNSYFSATSICPHYNEKCVLNNLNKD